MGEVEEIITKVNPKYKQPVWEHVLNYETTLENLEPIYFWIIDFAQKVTGFKKLDKLSDNFTATPGSSYFADLSGRASRMQEEGMKILGYVNTVTKSILNLIYDLKEFEIRLKQYEDANSEDPKTKETGILALKQTWMSSVDAKRGMGSIDNMAHQYGFSLLRPAFVAAKSVEEVDKMDLNEMIKRILKPRIAEFLEWAKLSEVELRSRYNIERSYLRNQVATLKLYTSWIKPYLNAAKQLGMGEKETPSLVSIFGTMILELELMGLKEIDIVDKAMNKYLPKSFAQKAKDMRGYNEIMVINFSFRTFPIQQALHAGKVTISFRAYALNDDELLLFKELKKEKDRTDIFAVTNITEETLDQLKGDIEKFTKPEEKKEKEKEEGMFSGIFSDFMKTLSGETKSELLKKYSELYEEIEDEKLADDSAVSALPIQSIKNMIKELEEKKKKKSRIKEIRKNGVQPDTYEEGVVRQFAESDVSGLCFKIYDTFKKSRGMASYPSPFDEPDVIERVRAKRAEIEALLKAKGELE